MADIEIAKAFFLLGFVVGGVIFAVITWSLTLFIYNLRLSGLVEKIGNRLLEIDKTLRGEK